MQASLCLCFRFCKNQHNKKNQQKHRYNVAVNCLTLTNTIRSYIVDFKKASKLQSKHVQIKSDYSNPKHAKKWAISKLFMNSFTLNNIYQNISRVIGTVKLEKVNFFPHSSAITLKVQFVNKLVYNYQRVCNMSIDTNKQH